MLNKQIIIPAIISVTILHLSVMVLLLFLVKKNFKDLTDNKEEPLRSENVLISISTTLWLIILTLLLILKGLLNINFEFIESGNTFKLGFGFYFLIFMFIGYLIWINIFKTNNQTQMSIYYEEKP